MKRKYCLLGGLFLGLFPNAALSPAQSLGDFARDQRELRAKQNKATRVYTNDDVTRQNDTNGTVKHGGKTEKM